MSHDTFSLRSNIPELAKAESIVPLTPDFPFNTQPDEKHGGVGIKSDIVDKVGRGDESPFSDPFSLRVTKVFRDTSIHHTRSMVKFRRVALGKDFEPLPIWDVTLDAPSSSNELYEGSVIMMAFFDECSSIGRFFFFRVTSFGMTLAGKHPVKFVNLERILYVEDKPDATRIVTEEGYPMSKEQTDAALSKCWSALASFSKDTGLDMAQHLYPGAGSPIDPKAYQAENPTLRFVEESVPASAILPYLRLIANRRNDALKRSHRYLFPMSIAARRNVDSITVVTLPTEGVNAPVAILNVPVTADEWELLVSLEPALGTLPPASDRIEGDLSLHQFTARFLSPKK